jgi:hypothetical protein
LFVTFLHTIRWIPKQRGAFLNDRTLIDHLARAVLNWRLAPDRFLTGNGSWLPRWRFNPLQSLDDAFRLLDHNAVIRYNISRTKDKFHVEIESNGRVGTAAGASKPRTITLALARSLGLEV